MSACLCVRLVWCCLYSQCSRPGVLPSDRIGADQRSLTEQLTWGKTLLSARRPFLCLPLYSFSFSPSLSLSLTPLSLTQTEIPLSYCTQLSLSPFFFGFRSLTLSVSFYIMLSVKIPCGRAVSNKHNRTHIDCTCSHWHWRACVCAYTHTHTHTHAWTHICITCNTTIVFTETRDGNKRFSHSIPLSLTHTHICTNIHTHKHTHKNPTKCSIFCRCVVIYERCFSQQADSPVWNASFHKSILHSHFSVSPPSPPLLYFLFSPLCRTPSASVDTYSTLYMCVCVCVCVCEWVSVWMGRGWKDISRLCLQSG